MTGAGLWQFLITCIELFFIGAMIFLGIDYVIAPDENFKKIAKYAVGGVLILYFLVAVGNVFLGIGGPGAVAITPVSLLLLAIALIVLFVVVYIVVMVVDKFAPEPAKAIIKYVVGAVAIIIILGVTAQALSGGSLLQAGNFRLR